MTLTQILTMTMRLMMTTQIPPMMMHMMRVIQPVIIQMRVIQIMSVLTRIDAPFVMIAWIAVITPVLIAVMMGADAVIAAVCYAATFVIHAAVAWCAAMHALIAVMMSGGAAIAAVCYAVTSAIPVEIA
jgi:hypothetical protein